jgi:frataxin
MRSIEGMLNYLADTIEDADPDGMLDVMLSDGVLTIELDDGRQFVINRHIVNQELWLSSPVSGAKHFQQHPDGWKTRDGEWFHTQLSEDLMQSSSISIPIKASVR